MSRVNHRRFLLGGSITDATSTAQQQSVFRARSFYSHSTAQVFFFFLQKGSFLIFLCVFFVHPISRFLLLADLVLFRS
jgi:hypothetical protein